MANRQTRDVRLSPSQDAFIESMIACGRYRTASEVFQDGLRLLEESEHRRLLEQWVYDGLSAAEEEQLPDSLKERARAHFAGLVDSALHDVEHGRVADGPATMKRLREQLKARFD